MADTRSTSSDPRSEQDSARVLHALAAGEPDALPQFTRVFGALVWSIARTYFTKPADAEDAAQEALVRIWRTAHQFDPARGSPGAFVIVVSRGAILDYRKKTLRVRDRGVGDDASRPELAGAQSARGSGASTVGLGVNQEQSRAAQQAMAALPVEQREAITLTIQSGLTHEAVAKSLGVPLGTVKTRIRTGLLTLRGKLGSGERLGADGGYGLERGRP